MDIETNWDNDKEIFHDFTDANWNRNFNVLYEEFEDRWYSVCGCNNNTILYLMRNNLIKKYEADDSKAEYVTLDQQFIQRATIVKDANVNDISMEILGRERGKPMPTLIRPIF